MANAVIGFLLNMVWAVPLLAFLLWRSERKHRQWSAMMDAREKAAQEEWDRKQALWAEEDRRRAAEEAERERQWAEREEELRQLEAEIAALEARAGAEPSGVD